MKKILFLVSFLCTAFMINAQTVSVSGTITDPSGNPVPGVQIVISNPILGAPVVGWSITDNNGSYYWLDSIGGFALGAVGVLDVSITDCDGTAITQSITYTPNLLNLTANFNYCANGGGSSSCALTLSPATVNGNMVAMSANLVGGVTPNAYNWDMGDGTSYSGQNVNHTYQNAGTYNVCAFGFDASGCGDTACVTIVATGSGGGNCGVIMGYYPDSLNMLTQHFSLTTTGGTAPYVYAWDFGDGNISTVQSPIHTYAVDSIYLVCVTITDANGCSSTDCQPVVAISNSNCYTYMAYSPDTTNMMTYHFNTQNSSTLGTTYVWDFGDGSTSTQGFPTHTYTATGTYTVCVTVTDAAGCSSTDCQIVHVAGNTPCQASITYINTPGSLTVSFVGNSGTNNFPITYAWDFGDGTTSTVQTPTHTYTTLATGPVTFNVTLTITDNNGCIAVATETVLVFGGNVSGQIIGYLWKDTLNATPADGLVYLIEYDSIAGTLTAIDTVQTQQGLFDFQNVPMGSYLVKAALLPTDVDYAAYLPTYFVQSLNWSNAQYVGPVPFGLPAFIDIQLVAGNNPGGAGFIGGLVVNGAGRPVTGTVTLVEDILNAEPMEGVSVLLLDANNNPVTHTVTAADGSYSFSNIAMGSYNVHVEEVGKVTYDANVLVDANNTNHTSVHFTVHENMVTLTGAYAVTNVEGFEVFPNPVQDAATVQLQLTESMDFTLTVTNLMGQMFVNQNMRLNAGDNTFPVEMSDLPAGLYLLSLRSGADVITYKIQKM